MLLICGIHRKGNQCRRNVDLVKGSGHAVLSSDGRQPKAQLGLVGPQQCGERLAPAGGLLRHPTEILLERKTDLFIIASCCHDLGHRRYNCVYSAVIRAPAG